MSSAITANQIFYDPRTNCAYAKPDQVLRQQTSYVFAVTDSIQDADGHKVKESKDFKDCLNKSSDAYCDALAGALDRVGNKAAGKLIAASLFTTLSATNWMEKARDFVSHNQPSVVLPAGPVPVFALQSLQHIIWYPQDNSGAAMPTSQEIPLGALKNVSAIAFGLYLSPNFLNVSGPLAGSISPTPTNLPIAPIPVPGLPALIPPGYVPVSFHIFLPAAAKPPGGYPLVIYGHGLGDSQFGAPTYFASTLADKGFATLAMEITGHGFGPGGTVQLIDNANQKYTVAAPGRGIAFSSGPIGATDGCILPGALAVRDCGRQSAVDLLALVATLRGIGGLGYLDTSRIYYTGQSFGGTYGTLFHAVEQSVMSAVLNGAGGTSVDVARLAVTGRQLGSAYLKSFNPTLLNVPPAPPEAYFHDCINDCFNDNYVFRDQPPVVNTIPGAPAIQAAFEAADWLGMIGDPLAYAQHLNLAPLPGVAPKRTLFQFGLGDLEVPNPTESAVVRAAGAQSSTWFLRLDVAAQSHPELLGITMAPAFPLPILPHRFLSNPTIFAVPAELSISLAAQKQVASFFAGQPNPDPNLYLTGPFSSQSRLFQIPPVLPEALNFLQIPR